MDVPFDPFLEAMAEILQKKVRFLGDLNLKTPKFHSDINWPLVSIPIIVIKGNLKYNEWQLVKKCQKLRETRIIQIFMNLFFSINDNSLGAPFLKNFNFWHTSKNYAQFLVLSYIVFINYNDFLLLFRTHHLWNSTTEMKLLYMTYFVGSEFWIVKLFQGVFHVFIPHVFTDSGPIFEDISKTDITCFAHMIFQVLPTSCLR